MHTVIVINTLQSKTPFSHCIEINPLHQYKIHPVCHPCHENVTSLGPYTCTGMYLYVLVNFVHVSFLNNMYMYKNMSYTLHV